MGGIIRRHRAGADLEPAPARRPLPRGQLGQLLLHAAVEHPAGRSRCIIMPSDADQPGGAGEAGVAASFAAVACAYARATGTMPTYFPINHGDPLAFTPKPSSRPSRSRPPTACKLHLLRSETMPEQTFILNGKQHHRGRPRRRARPVGAARPARRHRPEVRLRHQRLQGVHVAHQRQGLQPLLGAGRRPRAATTR